MCDHCGDLDHEESQCPALEKLRVYCEECGAPLDPAGVCPVGSGPIPGTMEAAMAEVGIQFDNVRRTIDREIVDGWFGRLATWIMRRWSR